MSTEMNTSRRDTGARLQKSAGVATLALFATCGQCLAATGEESSGLQEIVVTAQFRETRLQDTPIAITAMNAELLEARNVTSITQIGEQAPNVTIKPAGSVYGPASQVFIRGIGQGDTNFALEPGVGVYIDDVYYSTVFGTVFDLVDLDRVEILRGPQGTLAGKNSLGGALKLFSRQPGNEFEGSIEANAGQFDRMGLRGSVNLPLVMDRLALRLAAVARYSDGYVTSMDYGCLYPASGVPSFRTSKSCKVGSEGGQQYFGLRGALRWTPADAVTVTITGDLGADLIGTGRHRPHRGAEPWQVLPERCALRREVRHGWNVHELRDVQRPGWSVRRADQGGDGVRAAAQ